MRVSRRHRTLEWAPASTSAAVCLLCLLVVAIAAVAVGVAVDEAEDKGFVLAAYLPDYRMQNLHQLLEVRNATSHTITGQVRVAADLPLTDILLFSLQPHSRGFLGGCCLNEEHFRLARAARDSPPPLNHQQHEQQKTTTTTKKIDLWITLGGAGRTDAFAEICLDEKRTQRLIESVIKLCAKETIQGVDLDFFRPRSIQEQQAYINFLDLATTSWHDAGLKVSMTLFPRQRLPVARLYDQLDRIHLMAYDMMGGGGGSGGSLAGGSHASLDKVKQVVDFLLEPGAGLDGQHGKVILGIPAFARHRANPGDAKTFAEIYDGVINEHVSDSPDNGSDGLTTSLASWSGYEWDSPSVIQEKVLYATGRNLGGIFFWELGQDKRTEAYPFGILLESAAEAIVRLHQGTATASGDTSHNKEEL